MVQDAKCDNVILRNFLSLVLYKEDIHPIITPINMVIVGMIFIHIGSLHLDDIFGRSQIIIEPDITDIMDIIIIGFTTFLSSVVDEHGL